MTNTRCFDCEDKLNTECPEQYISISVLARRMGVTTRQINKWQKEGQITCFKEDGAHRRFPERRATEEVREILRDGEMNRHTQQADTQREFKTAIEIVEAE
jgi:DNA-binding transcriptional MerR regulator